MKKLLIDLDGILFRCMLATKDQGYYPQLRACYTTVDRILDRWDNPEYLMALTGSNNFRKQIYPEYKANRDATARPRYLWEARQYFIKYYGAVVANGMEADDLVAMNASPETVVVGNDKDYLQLAETWVYNPWKDETVYVDEYTADLNFCIQLLTGDSVDNVPGLPNPAKAHFKKQPNFTKDTASEVLEGKSREEMLETVTDLYRQVYGDDWFSRYDLAASLLFLRRRDAESYASFYL
jgi:5'-3' exonuclease